MDDVALDAQTESGAIVQYLAMKHAGLKDPQEIATMSRWHLFAMATLVCHDVCLNSCLPCSPFTSSACLSIYLRVDCVECSLQLTAAGSGAHHGQG